MAYTMQEAFDKVATHLLHQGKRAESHYQGSLGCMYLIMDDGDGNSLMCGVGCLIPYSKYTPDIEGIPAFDLFHDGDFGWFAELFNREESKGWPHFLSGVQRLHDCMAPHQWPEELRKLATRFNLKWNLDGVLV